MKESRKRTILRWTHIILGIPIIGYIYSPFEEIPNYAPATRFVFLPLLVLMGLWMWKGHVVLRVSASGSPKPHPYPPRRLFRCTPDLHARGCGAGLFAYNSDLPTDVCYRWQVLRAEQNVICLLVFPICFLSFTPSSSQTPFP